ncbi:hypothetical protein GRJ2_000918400 [Grus japonensis]|uniref:Uncharacterized protein n=1 Tax=Grus japonensis TaxID=30415 RepID=A0ABC9WH03_GRUJA
MRQAVQASLAGENVLRVKAEKIALEPAASGKRQRDSRRLAVGDSGVRSVSGFLSVNSFHVMDTQKNSICRRRPSEGDLRNITSLQGPELYIMRSSALRCASSCTTTPQKTILRDMCRQGGSCFVSSLLVSPKPRELAEDWELKKPVVVCKQNSRNKKLSTGEVNFWCVDEASESVWCLLTPFPLDSISLHMLGLAQGITRDLSPSSAPCQEAATRPEP